MSKVIRRWRMVACVLAGAAFVVSAKTARASTIDLTYTFDTGSKIALALGGNLQSDGNTFAITGVQSVSVNGNIISDPFSVVSTDSVYVGGNTGPTATLNGYYLDLFVTDTLNGNVFGLAVRDVISQYVSNVIGASVALGGDGGEDGFQLASLGVAVVPEPSTLAMLAGMLALLGFVTAKANHVRRTASEREGVALVVGAVRR